MGEIELKVVGNAKRDVEDLSRSMDGLVKKARAGFTGPGAKKESAFYTGARPTGWAQRDYEAYRRGDINEKEMEKRAKYQSRLEEQAEKETAKAQREQEKSNAKAARSEQLASAHGQSQIESVVASAGEIAGQSSIMGAAGVGVQKIGGLLGKAKWAQTAAGGAVVGGVAALGMGAAIIGSLAAGAESTEAQLAQLGAMRGGIWPQNTENLREDIGKVSAAAGVGTSEMRRMATIMAGGRPGGKGFEVQLPDDKQPGGTLYTLGVLSKSFGVGAEQLAGIANVMQRSGMTVGPESLKKSFTYAIASGLKPGQIVEQLQGVANLQEDLLRAGISSGEGVEQAVTSLAQFGEGWRGKFGVEKAAGITQAFQAAAAGGGGTGGNILYAALASSRQFSGMSYYQVLEQMEKGAGDSRNLDALREYIKRMAPGDVNAQADLYRTAVGGLTFTAAKQVMVGAKGADFAEAQGKFAEQVKGWNESEAKSLAQSKITEDLTKETLSGGASTVKTGVYEGIKKLGEGIAKNPLETGLAIAAGPLAALVIAIWELIKMMRDREQSAGRDRTPLRRQDETRR